LSNRSSSPAPPAHPSRPRGTRGLGGVEPVPSSEVLRAVGAWTTLGAPWRRSQIRCPSRSRTEVRRRRRVLPPTRSGGLMLVTAAEARPGDQHPTVVLNLAPAPDVPYAGLRTAGRPDPVGLMLVATAEAPPWRPTSGPLPPTKHRHPDVPDAGRRTADPSDPGTCPASSPICPRDWPTEHPGVSLPAGQPGGPTRPATTVHPVTEQGRDAPRGHPDG